MKSQSGTYKQLNGGEDSAKNLRNALANFGLRAVMLCTAMVALANWMGCTSWGGWNSCGILAHMTTSKDAKRTNISAPDAFLTEPWSMVCTFFISCGKTEIICNFLDRQQPDTS